MTRDELNGAEHGTPWQAGASCRTLNPAETDRLFFPARGDPEAVRRAKAICATCPVADRCLAEALRGGAVSGIWGGTSERERRHLRTARSASAAVALGLPARAPRRIRSAS